ncbi:MAG: transcription antitermination factor NusB [Dehalococcoidia bacterium]
MTENVMRRVRYLVVEALYEADASGHEVEAVLKRRLSEMSEEEPDILKPGPSGYAVGAARGVTRRMEELDTHIQDAATQYPVDTLAVVDRNILRLAIWELLSDGASPVPAVVNEAVELAHRYGGETSPAFVNGVLRTVSERISAARAARSAPGPESSPSTESTP